MARRRGGKGKRRATRLERAANAGGCAKACMAVGSRGELARLVRTASAKGGTL